MSVRRIGACRHSLDLARHPARADWCRFGFFQHAVASGHDRVVAKRTLGHGDRHYQRDLRPGPYAGHLVERNISDPGLSLLLRHSRDDSQPRRYASFRRVDERDLSVRLGNQSYPIDDFTEDEEKQLKTLGIPQVFDPLISAFPVYDIF